MAIILDCVFDCGTLMMEKKIKNNFIKIKWGFVEILILKVLGLNLYMIFYIVCLLLTCLNILSWYFNFFWT